MPVEDSTMMLLKKRRNQELQTKVQRRLRVFMSIGVFLEKLHQFRSDFHLIRSLLDDDVVCFSLIEAIKNVKAVEKGNNSE
jgi:hypothetical protein